MSNFYINTGNSNVQNAQFFNGFDSSKTTSVVMRFILTTLKQQFAKKQ